MIKTAQPTAFRLVRIKDTFQLQNKTPTSQLADRQVGWELGQSSMKNSWLGKQREKLGQRGHRGCVVHSPLLLKEMILLMWALTGPEWVCLSPQVWIHNGVSPSAVADICSQWELAYKGWTDSNNSLVDISHSTVHIWQWHTKKTLILKCQNNRKSTKLLFILSWVADNKLMCDTSVTLDKKPNNTR